MLSAEEQEQHDRALALQLQRQEFTQQQLLSDYNPRQRSPSVDQLPGNIAAPLLDANNIQDNRNNNRNNRNNRGNNQDRLRRNVIESVRESEGESPRLLLFRIAISLIEIITTAVILAIGWNDYCDEPLKWWILAYSCRHFIDRPLRIHIYRLRHSQSEPTSLEKSIQLLRWLGIFSFLLFLIGNSFLFTGNACENTSPTIWYYCLVIIILNYIFLTLPFLIILAICICLPCVLIIFRWFAEPEGADLEAIKKLPTRKIQESDIENSLKDNNNNKIKEKDNKNNDDNDNDNDNDDDDNDDNDEMNRPSCAICMTEYSVGDELRILPCRHEFHIDCVDKWLPMKKVCPLCRHDITQSSSQKANNNNNNSSRFNRNNSNQNNNNNNNNNQTQNREEIPLISSVDGQILEEA